MGLRYGQGKYGSFRYGTSEAGFQFLVQISDSAGSLVKYINNEVKSLNWKYKRNGGCGKFQIVLKRSYNDLSKLTASSLREIYDFQIYITSALGGTSTRYYRGYITNIRPNLQDGEETIVTGVGYSERLNEIQIQDGTGAPKEYTATTISGAVNSIINDFITPNTPITAGTVDTFSTTVDSIKFNGSAYEALEKLASLVDAEWGVDRTRAVYFRAKSSTVGSRFRVGIDIGKMDDEFDYSDIVNRVYIEGGDVGGVPFRYVKSNQSSIDAFGLKEQRLSNSSVVDNTVATVFADSVLNKRETYLRNIRLRIPFNKSLIETNNPLDLVVIVHQPKLVTKKYGTFKYGAGNAGYSGETSFRIDSIEYDLKDVSLDTSIELNEGKPDITNDFELLNFQIEQQRQAAGI